MATLSRCLQMTPCLSVPFDLLRVLRHGIADLYKIETTIPVAFEIATQPRTDPIDRAARIRLRTVLRERRILKRIASDLALLFDVIEGEDPNRIDAGKLWDGENQAVKGGINHAEEL